MATILVTGSAGFIASNLSRTLLDKGHVVYGVDNYITGSKENTEELLTTSNFTFHEKDITSPRFKALFKNIELDQIYHLACPTGVPNVKLLPEEMLATCSIGTCNVLDLAKEKGAKLLFTSTAEMYGQPEKFPQDEEYNGNVSPTGERSPYEEGKRFSESCLMMYVRKYKLDARIVRVFNTYGPGMSLADKRIIPQMLQSALQNLPIRIYGDGSQTRCHLYVSDLVRGLQIVMEKGKTGEVYNVGSDRELSILELAEIAVTLTKSSSTIEFKPHFIEDHLRRRPSVEKVKKLGWKQKVSLEEGIPMLAAHLATKKIW